VMSEAFLYVFRDRESGAVFTAYSAGAGPGYGAGGSRFRGKLVDGPGVDGAAIAKAVDSFDALLEATKPQDCELELGTDAGRMRVGVRNGRPYDLPTGAGCAG
ncbi:MAG: hypothetical protein IT520_20540, partial [Burkholderiales bacterium]|nr:hypothetical protein [Burkholderiales bacterium]